MPVTSRLSTVMRNQQNKKSRIFFFFFFGSCYIFRSFFLIQFRLCCAIVPFIVLHRVFVVVFFHGDLSGNIVKRHAWEYHICFFFSEWLFFLKRCSDYPSFTLPVNLFSPVFISTFSRTIYTQYIRGSKVEFPLFFGFPQSIAFSSIHFLFLSPFFQFYSVLFSFPTSSFCCSFRRPSARTRCSRGNFCRFLSPQNFLISFLIS